MAFPKAGTKTGGTAGSTPIELIPVNFEGSKDDISHRWQGAIAVYDYGRIAVAVDGDEEDPSATLLLKLAFY